MDLYTPPGWGKKSGSPKPNSFQRELDAKMKERKRLGLSADMTPSASERGSDDELASDDELMAQFNMTNKSKKKSWTPPNQRPSPGLDRLSPGSNHSKSPYDLRRSPASDLIFGRKTPATEDDDDEDDSLDGPSNLMMTMKKPWNPSSVGSKTLPNPKTRKSKAFDMFNEESSRDQDSKERTWTPPSFKKEKESEKENKPLRPKSPNVRGRKTPNLELDSIKEEDKPVPSPRIFKDKSDARPKPKPRGRLSPKGYQDSEDEDEEMKLLSARRESPFDLGKHRDADRGTPSEGRRTPKVNIFGRNTPGEDRKTPADGRRTPKDGRRTPKEERRTPVEGRKSPGDGRQTPADERRTPKGGKRLTFDDRKGSKEERDSSEVKKKSMLDMYSSSKSSKKSPKGKHAEKKKSFLHESSSDDEGMGAPRRSPSPMMKGRKTPERDGYSFGSSRLNKHGRETPEDDVDGFRMGPSLRSKNQNRASPCDEGPSLRSKSPYDSQQSRSPYGDGLKPKLSRNKAVEEDDEDDRASAFRPTPTRRHQKRTDDEEDRGRSRSRGNKDDRESSVCREVEKDPNMKKHQEKVKEKKLSKAHTTQGRDLENAIVSVENAQSNTMKFIDPDKEATKDEEENKTQTLTPKTPKHRPKPRYAQPSPTTPKSPESFNFNSTSDIKQAVYQQWYAERQKKAKLALKEKKAQEKELLAKKKKAEEDKFIEAKASYQAWMEKKKDFDQERREKKQKEEEKKMKKLQEEEDKKKDAVVSYRMWKENKDGSLREQHRKKLREQQEKEDEERNVKNTKQKESQTAFKRWKENKDNHLKKQSVQNKKMARTKKEEEEDAQYQREREASESYEKWMARKEKQQQREKKHQIQRHLEEEDNPRPSWSPASRTIPFGR